MVGVERTLPAGPRLRYPRGRRHRITAAGRRELATTLVNGTLEVPSAAGLGGGRRPRRERQRNRDQHRQGHRVESLHVPSNPERRTAPPDRTDTPSLALPREQHNGVSGELPAPAQPTRGHATRTHRSGGPADRRRTRDLFPAGPPHGIEPASSAPQRRTGVLAEVGTETSIGVACLLCCARAGYSTWHPSAVSSPCSPSASPRQPRPPRGRRHRVHGRPGACARRPGPPRGAAQGNVAFSLILRALWMEQRVSSSLAASVGLGRLGMAGAMECVG